MVTDTATAPEKQVKHFIQTGQNGKAAQLLYQLALSSARRCDFVRSERFRDRLYELDSMALSQIVKVNEVIETQKSKVLTPNYRRRWAPLFDRLSKEEAHAFFLALKTLDIGSEKVVLKQGQPNDKLLLIQKGRLKITYTDQEKDFLIDTLGSGDIIGQDTFFSVNVSTVTVKTLTPVRLSYMDRTTFERIKAHGSFSEDSLKRACCLSKSLPDRLRQKGLDRRSNKRFNLSTKVSFQLLSSDPKRALRRTITAELWDISKSGLSFYFHSKNRKTVRSLMGRTLGVRFNVDIKGRSKAVAVTGVVHGLASHPLDEYSIHLKLKHKFSDAAFKSIQASAL